MRARRGFHAHLSYSPLGLSAAAIAAKPVHAAMRSLAMGPLVSALLAAGVLGAAVVFPASVWAQAAAAKQAGTLHQFDIPAGPLSQALAQFGAQAGIALAGDVALTQGKQTAGIRGNYTAPQGLKLLLQGTDIQAQPDASGRSFILSPVTSLPEVQITAGAERGTALPEVLVTAAATGATENTGSYTQTGPSRAATGLPLTLRETPQSVSVMTRQRMDDFKLNTLTEVLEQTPGVAIDRQGDASHFLIRGSNVNLQVNGMRQMASGWAVNAQKFYSMDDMVEIDRIEVLKGSSGLMNGDGNYGGTVNMIRKRPSKDFKASVGTGFGSWQNVRGDVDVGGPLNESGSVRGRVVAAANDGHDFRDYVKRKNQTLFGTLEVDLTPNTLLNVDLTYRHRDFKGTADTSMIQAYNANGQYLGLQPRSFNPGAPWSGFEQSTRAVFANLEHQFANGWTTKLRANYEKTQNPYYEAGYWWTVTPEAVDVAWTSKHYNLNHSVSLDAQGPFELFGRSHDLMLGLDSGSTKTHSVAGSGRLSNLGLDYSQGGGAIVKPDMSEIAQNNISDFSSKRSSAYVAARLNLADPVKLIVGARITDYKQLDVTPYAYSNNDYRKHGVITPYAGLVVDVHENVSLYGSYASIFKPQSAVDAQGQTLDPEQGNTYELGAKGEFFNQRLNASLSHFWMRTDNVAENTGDIRPDGSAIYRSVSGVRRHGYELELSGELASGWQAQGSFVMNSSTLQSSNNVPKRQFKLATSYALDGALRGLSLGAATRWQSKTAAGRLEQPTFWVVDLMANYQVNQQWSLNFNVRNAFDKSYFAGMRDFGRVQYVWGAPRSYNVSMRYTF